MHLDPRVNRLGFNITSVHQTDRRPVTPDIVLPICVILEPQQDELGKKTHTVKQKEVITFDIYASSLTLTHMHPGSNKPALVPCFRKGFGKKSDRLQNQAKTCKSKAREKFEEQAALRAGRIVSGKLRW